MRIHRQLIAHRNLGGFNLIEVMVTMALMGIALTSLYAGMGFGTSLIAGARENLRATQILVERMETLRLYTFTQITSNGFMPLTFTVPFHPGDSNDSLNYQGRIVVTNSPLATAYSADSRMVTVSLDWVSGSRPQSRSISTLVSRNGLQSYVY